MPAPKKRKAPKRTFQHQNERGKGRSPAVSILRIAVLLALWGSILLAGFAAYCALDLPDIHQVAQAQKRPSIVLEAEDGTVIAHYGDLYGDRIILSEVPKYLPQAIIAIEDRRFYDHIGIDFLGMARAMVRNIVAGHLVQGGSTLTQQLAKNLFLTPDRTAKRKMQEMMLALWLEHSYSKEQILTAYMNRVYLGNGSYGFDAAAHAYFDKSARELSLHEAAILAGLLRAPSRLAPSNDPVRAAERAKLVLNAMAEEGYITPKQKDAAEHTHPLPTSKPGVGGDGRYFSDWIVDQLGSIASDTEQDIIVRTTLDLGLQRIAERNVDSILATHGADNVSQAAMLTLAHDGAIRVMVGGRNYHQSQFNRATQALRQPGSSFKPFVYLAALQSGVTPDDIIPDDPIRLGKWSPENFDGKFRGPISVREALAESINTVAVRLFMKAGASAVIDTAHSLGITSQLEPEAALALGASVVTPLELTTAYAALAAGGAAITPYGILEIRSRGGEVMYRHPDLNPPTVVSSSAVQTLVGMMQGVIDHGTGKRAALDGRDVAGKTGTSSDYRDAWFMGFTGNYTTAVWMGNDNNSPMKKITGGNLPAQLWHDFMMEAEMRQPARDLLSGDEKGAFSSAVPAAVSNAFENFVRGVVGEH